MPSFSPDSRPTRSAAPSGPELARPQGGTPGGPSRPQGGTPGTAKKPRGRAFGPGHQPRGEPWTPAEIATLGTATDGTISARLGRSRAAVIAKRLALGIPAATRPGRPARTPAAPVQAPTIGQGARSKNA